MPLGWTVYRAIVAGAMLAVLVALPARADEKFTDIICPGSVASVETYNGVSRAQPMDAGALLAAAIAAGDTYEICAEQQRSSQRIEPQAHYAQYRAAQYDIVAARVELQLGKIDAARNHLKTARQDATDVAFWQPFGRGASTHSVWMDRCKAILTAADETAKDLPSPEPAKPPTR